MDELSIEKNNKIIDAVLDIRSKYADSDPTVVSLCDAYLALRETYNAYRDAYWTLSETIKSLYPKEI